MPVLRKLWGWFIALMKFLWKKFWKLPWKGKAIAITVLVALFDKSSALQLAAAFIICGALAYMLRKFWNNTLGYKPKK